jgi:ABC-type lipoprotein export system ATPase subunit
MKIKNLSFKFDKSGNYFFKDLKIDFALGKINFIQGKNGVGKSTLFNILLGNIPVLAQVTGDFELDKQIFNTQQNVINPKMQSHIKMVQQQFDRMLALNFSFDQNLQIAQLKQYPGLEKLPKIHALSNLITSFSIPRDLPIKLLSGGQRQILSILMVLQKPTKLLLLDEPTAALDEKNSDMVMQFLQQLAKEAHITILIISHDSELIKKYAHDNYYRMIQESNGQRVIIKS